MSYDEIYAEISASNSEITSDDLGYILRQLDPDGDGHITLDEYREHRRRAAHNDLSDEVISKLMGAGGLACLLILFAVLWSMFATVASFESLTVAEDLIQLDSSSGGLAGLAERSCSSSPCQNGGFCTTNFDTGGYDCVCANECSTGAHCETLDSGCVSAAVANADTTVANTSRATWVSGLRNHLLADYNSLARPYVSQTSPTIPVTLGIGLLQLAKVEPRDGTWTINMWLRASWTDPYLTWDPADWGGITELDLYPEPPGNGPAEIWTPDISFYNQQGIPKVQPKPAFVYSSGYVYYSRPMTVSMACDISLKDFPFDSNICAIHLGCWQDHGFEVVLNPGSVQMAGLFIDNHEFVVNPYKTWQEAKYYPGYPEPWPEVFFTFKLTRHAAFYLSNLVTPTIGITYLGTLQFYIPVRGGASVDRMGLPAALLLSLVAVTFLVSEDAPVSSETTRIQRLTLLNLVWLISSMVATTFVLFLSTLKATVPSPILRTFLDLVHEDKDNHASVILDFFSVSLLTKGSKAVYMVVNKVLPVKDTVSMAEIGEVVDLLARIVYPCSYTWIIAATFNAAEEVNGTV
eukprot:COSAG05_NODE_222_length_13641_cov_73.452001_5_plen_577_part_00